MTSHLSSCHIVHRLVFINDDNNTMVYKVNRGHCFITNAIPQWSSGLYAKDSLLCMMLSQAFLTYRVWPFITSRIFLYKGKSSAWSEKAEHKLNNGYFFIKRQNIRERTTEKENRKEKNHDNSYCICSTSKIRLGALWNKTFACIYTLALLNKTEHGNVVVGCCFLVLFVCLLFFGG